jgi:hypothetical protein
MKFYSVLQYIAIQLGMQSIMWNYDTDDWQWAVNGVASVETNYVRPAGSNLALLCAKTDVRGELPYSVASSAMRPTARLQTMAISYSRTSSKIRPCPWPSSSTPISRAHFTLWCLWPSA